MLACISRVSNSSTAFTIFTGIFLAIVPAVTFSKLQTKTTKKIGVSIVMAFTLLYKDSASLISGLANAVTSAICAVMKIPYRYKAEDLKDSSCEYFLSDLEYRMVRALFRG